MADDEEYVKVRFRLRERTRGWPPVDTEGLWAQPVPQGFRLANAPFFARGYAEDDIVAATPDEDGTLWAGDVVVESGNCTIHLYLWDDRPGHLDARAAMAKLEPLGVWGEGYEEFTMLALTVPPDVDLRAVVTLLEQGAADGSWNYEEAWVTPAWHAAR